MERTTGRRSYDRRPSSPTQNGGFASDEVTPRAPSRTLAMGLGATAAVLAGTTVPEHPSRNGVSQVANGSGSERETTTSSKRLAIFGDKLSSQSPSIARTTAGSTQSHLLHPPPRTTSHARGDSSLSVNGSRDATASPIPSLMASNATPSKVHSSPSKGSARTYDSKLVSREMHRLGNLAHLPASLTPALSTSGSNISLTQPTMPAQNISSSSSSSDNPWGTLHVLVLPLFNGEPLRVPIEDLNTLVKRHIQSVLSNSPPKAIATLEAEAAELIASGMDTLNGKLAGLDDDKLVGRVVELWGFFWDQVLPYVEGVLLPLQTDPILSSLARTQKVHRNSSPTRQSGKGSTSSHLSSASQIDVRTLALRSFRDKIILPMFSQLHSQLSLQKQEHFTEGFTYPRLQQMLLVLVSQGRRQLNSVSLTAQTSQSTPGETAVSHLLKIVRSSNGARLSLGMSHPRQARTPSFLSAAIPRDRRGRIAQRPRPSSLPLDPELSSDDQGGGETPRTGFMKTDRLNIVGSNRERGREFLEALKSPEIQGTHGAEAGGGMNGNGNGYNERPRGSVGGWGLNAFGEEGRDAEEDDEDEQMDWDQAQAVVERMVGMKPNEPTTNAHPEPRRRPT